MNQSPHSWAERLVMTALALLVAAIALSWAWHLVRPLLPILVMGAVIVVLLRFLQRRREW